MVDSKAQCNLIVDACCDLPHQFIQDSNVTSLSFPFNMNDGEHYDDYWQSMQAKDFYNRLRKGEVSGTAQIPVPVLFETFEHAAQEGVPTVYLAFTSGLSGTYTTIESVAAQVRKDHPDFELYTVDTKLASIAEGLLVYEAIHQRDRGLTAKQLADWALEARWYVNAIFTVDQLETLRRGGRIPAAAASLAKTLNIKPLLGFDLDGGLALTGMARGRKKSLKAMVKFYEDNHTDNLGSDSTVVIGSADSEGDMKWIEEHLGRPETSIPAVRCSIGPVIGSHVGPDMVALVFWGPDRREKASVSDRIANKYKNDDGQEEG